jgi:hypothetical protein
MLLFGGIGGCCSKRNCDYDDDDDFVPDKPLTDQEKREKRSLWIICFTFMGLIAYFGYNIYIGYYLPIAIVLFFIFLCISITFLVPYNPTFHDINEITEENGKKCDTCDSNAYFVIENRYACRKHEVYERYRKK